MIESISAVTLATHNMPHAVGFYRVLGFEIVHGDDNAAFTSFSGGSQLSQSNCPAGRAALVLVGKSDLLPFGRRCTL